MILRTKAWARLRAWLFPPLHRAFINACLSYMTAIYREHNVTIPWLLIGLLPYNSYTALVVRGVSKVRNRV